MMKKQLSILMVMMMIAAPLAAITLSVGGENMPVEAPAFAGGDGSPGNPYNITDVDDLQNMSSDLSAHYRLINDIDASNTSESGHPLNHGGLGFAPIGMDTDDSTFNFQGTRFSGSFDGVEFEIKNLYINRPGSSFQGLFGSLLNTANIQNIRLVDGNVSGISWVGLLAGENQGTIIGCSASGTVTGTSTFGTGGLIGSNSGGDISDCYSTADVTGATYLGGLVGYSNGQITTSFATGNVTGSGTLVGGLVGYQNGGTISNCYATGNAIGTSGVGGFNGGLSGNVINSYSTGNATGTGNVGGFYGNHGAGTFTNCFWDNETSGTDDGVGNIVDPPGIWGNYTVEMMQQATFNGWDFTNTWFSVNGSTRPFLRWEYNTTIRNSHQLQLMVMNLTADYTLANDINLSDITNNASMWGTSVGDGEGFVPIGTSVDPFLGTLFGHGHVISNLFIDIPSTSNVGLFGHLQSGTVNGVSLVDFNITGYSQTAGLVGRNSAGGTINNCSINGNLTGVFNSNNVGGIVGLNYGLVSNCYAAGTVSGHFSVGGIVGQQPSGTIDNCYSVCSVTATSHVVGGILGICGNSGTVENSYSSGKVTSTGEKGGLIGAVNLGTVNNCFWDNETAASVLDDTGDAGNVTGITGLNTADMLNDFTFTNAGWDFTDTWFSVNSSTRPFLRMEHDTTIKNSHQLQLMQMNHTANYTIANDIDLDITNPASMWGTSMASGRGFLPIGNASSWFTGSFDGNGYTASGLYINRPSEDNVGLFGRISFPSTISNVVLDNVNVTGEWNVSALVGYSNQGDLSNCHANGVIWGTTNSFIGGLVGQMNIGAIENSSFSGDVTSATNYVGGLCGRSTGKIAYCNTTGNVVGGNWVGGLSGDTLGGQTVSHCHVDTNVSGGRNIGGLIGVNGHKVDNCTINGTITGTQDNIGGLLGFTSNDVTDSTSHATVNGTDSTGGLVGQNNGGTISNSYATGNVTGTGDRTGGLVGDNHNTVSNCSANGTVTGSGDNIGGLIGFGDGPVSDSTSFSKVSNLGGGHYYTGGLIGRQDGSTISSCEAYGNVTGSSFMTGGLIGFTPWATITNCSTFGVTKGIGNEIGGLVGRNMGTIINSHTYGDTGTNNLYAWIGGLVGHNVNSGVIQNSSAHGDVFGTSLTGGLVGENADTISNCSYNGAVTGTNNIGGLVGKNSGGTISNCSSKGTVIGNGDNVGGLIGYSNGPVSNSTSFSDVSNLAPAADNYYSTGGLIGELAGSTVSFSKAYGNVTGCKFYAGGLIGHITALATVTNSSAYGATKGSGSYIGGLAGRNEGTIINTSAYGNTGEANIRPWVGGLVGDNTGLGVIQNSSAHGDVFGSSLIGGLVGQNTGLIERCFSMGSVAGSVKTGGFVGQNGNSAGDGEILDCYSQGNVTANDKVGGFVGNQTHSSSTLTNVYSTGLVSGITNLGGLVGFNWAGTTIDSHWDIETSGHGTSDGGTGNTDMEMMSHSTFTNWNFTDVWGIHEANTYPFLLPFGVPPEPAADLEISLVDLQDPASTNGTLTYMLTLTNHGPHNAADVYVNITLPTEVSFLNSNQPLNVNGRYLDADIGSLLNGESGGAFINVTVNSFGSGELNCTAFVTSPTQDPGAFINETYELTQLHLAPVAVDDAETLDEDSGASTIYVLENDTDAEDDDITIIDVTQPNNGTVVITEAGKNLTYEPDADWNGINTFTYTIIDDVGGRDMATVTVTVLAVDDASIAVNDIYNVTEDSGATTFDVLANDYDIDGDAITISTATSPAHGSIVIAADGLSIDYTPDADFFGTDSFTYNVSSGISQATVTIDVTPVNDVPVITTTDIITAAEAVLYSVDYNATDVDLDTLTWSLTTNASWLNIRAGDGLLSGTPSNAGTYWLNVTVDDGNGGIDWSNFTLTVAAAPNAAPVISTATAPDGVEGQLYGFQVNATDADGDDLTWALDSNAAWLSLNGTGYLSGTPTADGTYWVLVTVDDGNGGSDSVNLTITILPDMDGDGTPDATDTDCDGDGVPNSEDDFPNDPAASVDTDDDGKPDDWNEGYTADDSTTGLVLDDDDDNDGILDIDDDNPLVPDDTGGSNTWLYIIIVIIVIVAIAGAAMFIRGGSGKPGFEEETPSENPVEPEITEGPELE